MYLDDMSGSKLVEMMRADQALSDISFILISSEDNPLYLDPVRQSGACAILTKPFELNKLRAVIFTTLDYLNPGSLTLDKGDFDVDLQVLVVDDSSSTHSYLIRVLNNIGIKSITKADSGKKEAEMVQSERDEKRLAAV
jgi:two-component system chemotaxis response regulator CheY